MSALILVVALFRAVRTVPVALGAGDDASLAVSNESGSSVSEFIPPPEGAIVHARDKIGC